MCNELLNNKEYINYQTGEILDLLKVRSLSEKSIIVVKPELWCNWDFEKNSELNLNIWKMTRGSDRKAWWYCNECGYSSSQVIHTKIKGTGCPVCKGKVATKENNLAVKNPELAKQWHPTKNGELTPYDITSMNNKKVWWLGTCGHEWEAAVGDRGNGKNCPYCRYNASVLKGFNDLWTTHPLIAEKLVNFEDGYYHSKGTRTKLQFKCDCGNIIKKSVADTVNRGLSCPVCKDGVSFGEKLMYSLLKMFNIEFKHDSSTEFSGKKRYDFILTDYNAIIEINGEHHHIEKTGYFSKTGTLEDEIENDIFKKDLALKNGIKHYFIIPIFNRDIEMFKENSIKSGLLKLLNITNVNWDELYLKSQKSFVLEVCEFYENNNMSTGEVANIFKVAIGTIIKYLKIGDKLNICKYTPNDEKSRSNSLKHRMVKVIRYDLDGNYIDYHNSIKDAMDIIGVNDGAHAITKCCRMEHITAYGFVWRFYDEYKNVKKIDIPSRKNTQKVVQLNMNGEFLKIFRSPYEAKIATGAQCVNNVCRGVYSQSAGFKWMYLKDYEKMIEEQNKIG